MIVGELKTKIDSLWDRFHSGGVKFGEQKILNNKRFFTLNSAIIYLLVYDTIYGITAMYSS